MLSTKPRNPSSQQITTSIASAHFDVETSTSSGSGAIVLAGSTITAPEWVFEIIDGLEGLKSEIESIMFGGLDEYQVLLNFSLEEMQQKLQLIINSNKMQDLLKLGEQCGVTYLSEGAFDKSTLPKDKLYIQIVRDEHSMPLSLYIGIINVHRSVNMSMDLPEVSKNAEMVRNNQLSYYSHIKEIESDFNQAAENVRNSPKELHPGLISDFNAKWEGNIILTLTYDATFRNIEMQARNSLDQICGTTKFTYRPPTDRHGLFSGITNVTIAATSSDYTPGTDTPKPFSIVPY